VTFNEPPLASITLQSLADMEYHRIGLDATCEILCKVRSTVRSQRTHFARACLKGWSSLSRLDWFRFPHTNVPATTRINASETRLRALDRDLRVAGPCIALATDTLHDAAGADLQSSSNHSRPGIDTDTRNKFANTGRSWRSTASHPWHHPSHTSCGSQRTTPSLANPAGSALRNAPLPLA